MNPLYIIESGLDDIDDGEVYDDNFVDMYELDDSVNQSLDGVYKLELKFNISSIPKKFKKNFETLAEYLKPLDEFLRRYFTRKTTILKTFDRLRYKIPYLQEDEKNPTVVDHMIFTNSATILKNALSIQSMKYLQVVIPCNFRENARAINMLIIFAFRTLQEYVHKYMNHGVKYPTVSDVMVYNPKTNEVASISHLTYRNNVTNSIKASLRKFHKIVLGEIDQEAYNKYFDSKTDMDYVNALLKVLCTKQLLAKAEINETTNAYIVKINARSMQIPSMIYNAKNYKNICDFIKKQIIFDVSETTINEWAYKDPWKNVEKFLAITTKEIKNCYLDIHIDDGEFDKLKISTLNLQGCHIKHMTVECGKKVQKNFKTTNGIVDEVEFKINKDRLK